MLAITSHIYFVCVCEPPSDNPIPPRPTVTTGVCLGWQVVPSACMEALMQHYQAAGFSEEVSRLVAAPRRPSGNRITTIGGFTSLNGLAAGQGIDPLGPTAAQIATFLSSLFETHGLSPQINKGYRSCLASVLNRKDKTAVITDKAISDMITCMELQMPRITPVLPQWDLALC